MIDIFNEIQEEIEFSDQHFKPEFNSTQEGYAVLLEEMDELWDEIKKSKLVFEGNEAMRNECIQIAAMAIKFTLSLCKRRIDES